MLIKNYYQLTKPGIIYGNLLTTSAGFFLASKSNIDFSLFCSLLSGTALVIASGCVLNNIIDLEIDRTMARTKIRPLVQNSISVKSAFLFGIVLGFTGFLLLFLFTNFLTLIAGLVGYIFYLGVYSYWKKKTIYGTLLGSVAGSTPPVAGYLAVTNQIDLASILLFLTLVFWQMAHFYAIAIYRLEEYKIAKIPLWPIVKGVQATKIQILLFTTLFGLMLPLFTYFNYSSYVYLICTLLAFLLWLRLSIQGFRVSNDKNWARRFFLFSQIVILLFSLVISVDAILF